MLPDDDQRQSAPVNRTHTSCEKTQLAADADRASCGQRSFFLRCGVVAVLATGLLVYSQTQALAWDEGYHLLAAQLIKAGKRPYLDFCFLQTPSERLLDANLRRELKHGACDRRAADGRSNPADRGFRLSAISNR
jgi:hypothetical protein